LRVFIGGYKREELVDLPDDELVALVRGELRKLMGISAEPTRAEIYHWRKSNAQYDVGHMERVDHIDRLAAEALPNVHFTGSAFRGVGIPDCIRQGEETAKLIVNG